MKIWWPLKRFEIVQMVIDAKSASRYLEIGTQTAACFSTIRADVRVGVDPDPWAEKMAALHCEPGYSFFCLPSDQYFESNDAKFDVVFIDGMHEREQWKRDVQNSIKVLNPGGVIICHDCLPPDERSQIVPDPGGGTWTGDVWKGWVDLRQSMPVKMMVVDTDFGCGVIIPDIASNTLGPIEEELTYGMLVAEKDILLNLVSVDEFAGWVSALPRGASPHIAA